MTATLTAVHRSIVDNDIYKLRDLIRRGVNFNQTFTRAIAEEHEGMSPLALACSHQKQDFVQLMLQNGADVNFRFASLNTTALMTAAFHGNVDILRMLLSAGANVKAYDLQQSTALGYAFGGIRNMEAIQLLIDSGVDVNQKNVIGMSSLLLVASYGDDLLVSTVLQAGADPKATNDFGHSALHIAVVGKRDLLGRLAAQGSSDARALIDKPLNRRNIDVALRQWALQNRHLVGPGEPDLNRLNQAGQFMMKVGQHMGSVVAADDELEAMRQRIQAVHRFRDDQMNQVKVNQINKPDMIPLTRFSGDATSALSSDDNEVTDVVTRCANILRMLIDARVDVSRADGTFGMTPLDMAMMSGDIESTAILVCAGSDVSHLVKVCAASDLYSTLIHNDRKRLTDLLTLDRVLDINTSLPQFIIARTIRPGAEFVMENPDEGRVPLGVAARLSDLDTVELLVRSGASVNGVGTAGWSPLADACSVFSTRIVTYLLSQGADLEYTNPRSRLATPLAAALLTKPQTDERKRDQEKVVDLLIKRGAKVDKEMADGRSPLILAFELQNMIIVDMLLSADTNVNFSNYQGVFYDLARQYQRTDRKSEDILRKISDLAKQIRNREAEQERWKQHQQQQQYPPTINSQYTPTPTVAQTTPTPPLHMNSSRNSSYTYTATGTPPSALGSNTSASYVLPSHLQHRQRQWDSEDSDAGSEDNAPLVSKGQGQRRVNVRY